MKILGIGNAIVDVICKIEDDFLTKNNLTKSTMKLVDEAEFKKLSSTLQITSTIALPIPKIFILSFLCFEYFLTIRITSGTNFTSYSITISCRTKLSSIIYYL